MKAAKLIITAFTFLASLQSFAVVTTESCISEGKQLGTLQVTSISQECKQLIFNRSSLNAYRNYEDKDVIVYGYKNFIFAYLGPESGMASYISRYGKSLPVDIEISGSGMNVDEILAIDIDFREKMIMALVVESDTKEKAVYSYRLWVSGNHVPIKKVKTPEMQTATNIRVDSINQKVYLLYEDEGKTIAYNTFANDLNTHMKKFKSAEVDRLEVTSGLEIDQMDDITFSSDGEKMYLLDNSSSKVLTFNAVGEKKRSPISASEIPGNIDLQILEYNSETSTVVGVTPQGKKLKLDGKFIERAPASQGNENAQGQGQGLDK